MAQKHTKHTKYCYFCRKTKSTDDFYTDRKRYDRLRVVCKICDHHTRRLRVYRLTRAEFVAMWETQDRRCDICGTRFKSREDAVIDHHHSSGKVRSLLCGRCNSYILPLVEGEGDLIDRAREYLGAHGNKSGASKRYNSQAMKNSTRNTYRSRAIRHNFDSGLRAEQRNASAKRKPSRPRRRVGK